MGIEQLTEIWRKALKTGEMTDGDYNYLRGDWSGQPAPKEGDNRKMVAQASCKLCSRDWPSAEQAPLSDIEAHRGNWSPSWGVEPLSPEYAGWWAGSSSTLFGPERWWNAAKPWLISHALAAGDPPKMIYLKTHLHESSRKIDGKEESTAWLWGSKARFSSHPAERFLWADPLDVHTLIQRSVAHPLMSLAAGLPITVKNWDHSNYGLPLASILDYKTQRPSAWGAPISLGQDAIQHLGDLPPLPSDLSWRYRWYEDGSRAVAISRGKTGTRGVVPLSIAKGSNVTYYTTAQDIGNGNWARPTCWLDGSTWMIESDHGQLEIPEPAAVVRSVVWDQSGARVDGEPPPSDWEKTDPAQLVSTSADVNEKLIPSISDAEQTERLRTCWEVFFRGCDGNEDGMKNGAKDLAKAFGWHVS